jgi:hypothetical protein
MNKKSIAQLTTIVMTLIGGGAFMFVDLGFGFTPLTKFFIVFFGLIAGLQCVPAILLFSGMIKGIFGRDSKAANQALN